MAQKLTLTGTPTSELRSVGDIFNFDMTQSTNNVPKGLPMPENPIVYTVFINKKQKDKLSVPKSEFPMLKLLVQGEPTLDLPVTDCPGEIGVLCKQIERIPSKDKQKDNQGSVVKEVAKASKEVTVSVTPELMGINQIVIPKYFENHQPESDKVTKTKRYIQKLGKVKAPLVLSKENVLWSGYVWYIAALECGLRELPVRYR